MIPPIKSARDLRQIHADNLMGGEAREDNPLIPTVIQVGHARRELHNPALTPDTRLGHINTLFLGGCRDDFNTGTWRRITRNPQTQTALPAAS